MENTDILIQILEKLDQIFIAFELLFYMMAFTFFITWIRRIVNKLKRGHNQYD